MARLHIAVAFAAASFALLLVFQLLSSFGFPKLDFLHMRPEANLRRPTLHQTPINLPSANSGGLENGTQYLLGVGKADITGPIVEVNMMGYADPNQVGSGLRQRLYSRAFIIGDIDKPEDRFVYLVLDTQAGDTAVRYGIIQGLRELGTEYHLYGQNNIAVTGTHSHSGPGAWLNYLLPQITSKGFDKQSYQAIVDGALLSIRRAHRSLRPGYLNIGSIDIKNANINRSLYAYLANPEEERAKYDSDVDKSMTLLTFKNAKNGKDLGVLTWFPVHGTSMLGNNTLISGDNKGVAARLFEKDIERSGLAEKDFLAGFSQANVGDTSPNVLGAYCEDGSGEQCSFEDSTCNGTKLCHGRGPFFRREDQGASSCFEIGRRQFAGARALYNSMDEDSTAVKGSIVKSLHTFHDFSNFTFQLPNGTFAATCPAALGYSFAAGTTDGPGAFDFKQNNSGSPNANPVWSVVSGFLRAPSELQKLCHSPKPILLDVGEIDNPYLWTPNIVDIQLLRVGQLLIVVSPGEATTMAGRRWKDAIASSASLASLTAEDSVVLLGGPANTYTHYIATEEEYKIQRYEGASTLYGPHTLNAYINLTTRYLPYLSSRPPAFSLPPGPSPPNNIDRSLSFIRGVVFDRTPFFKSFGDVISDIDNVCHPGQTVSVTFVGANPRNDLRLEQTYASVEKQDGNGSWRSVRDDADWSLVFEWKRISTMLGTSEVKITWEIEPDLDVGGVYRIKYFGASKTPLTGHVVQFEGVSGTFFV